MLYIRVLRHLLLRSLTVMALKNATEVEVLALGLLKQGEDRVAIAILPSLTKSITAR